MLVDLVITGATLAEHAVPMDIAVGNGLILDIAPAIASNAPRFAADGRLLAAGFVECHIHLDKADILDRCILAQGTLAEAVAETARLKAVFTEQDVYARASRIVEQAISHGTTVMRTFVEIDPRAGLRSFEAIKAVRRDYAGAIDIEICAFAQEGLTNEPETEGLLAMALADGADLVGGCSYTDPDPAGHIARIFDLAERFNVAADFHVDFDLDPAGSDLPAIIAETEKRGWQGRVACGHVTKLAAMGREAVAAVAVQLHRAGIGVVALPSTDLFLLGRDAEMLAPRGVAPLQQLASAGVLTAIASNNIINPFTPFGDASLLRQANLFANIAHLSRKADVDLAFAAIGANPARLLGRSHGIAVGASADLVLIDAVSPADAVRRAAPVLAGWKAGRQTFFRPAATLLRP
ncbi:amidohydrolase family protein [Devosia sp. SL43]|uniref:amidohydrolase family protein n=1 Tax=Devosia sp. SL43 TaxID=2806348 RepID=UPI001F3BD4C5|nr:amidohydrolase family protein [Devosia sp. SL43]UJW85701.1 amidohydrolase family protein [Devosia sp. SL43]